MDDFGVIVPPAASGTAPACSGSTAQVGHDYVDIQLDSDDEDLDGRGGADAKRRGGTSSGGLRRADSQGCSATKSHPRDDGDSLDVEARKSSTWCPPTNALPLMTPRALRLVVSYGLCLALCLLVAVRFSGWIFNVFIFDYAAPGAYFWRAAQVDGSLRGAAGAAGAGADRPLENIEPPEGRRIGYGILTGCNRFPQIADQLRSLGKMGVPAEDIQVMLTMCGPSAIYGKTTQEDCELFANSARVAQFWTDTELASLAQFQHMTAWRSKMQPITKQDAIRGYYEHKDLRHCGAPGGAAGGAITASSSTSEAGRAGGGAAAGIIQLKRKQNSVEPKEEMNSGTRAGAGGEQNKVDDRKSGGANDASEGASLHSTSTADQREELHAATASGLSVVSELPTHPAGADAWIRAEPLPPHGREWRSTTTVAPDAGAAAALLRLNKQGQEQGEDRRAAPGKQAGQRQQMMDPVISVATRLATQGDVVLPSSYGAGDHGAAGTGITSSSTVTSSSTARTTGLAHIKDQEQDNTGFSIIRAMPNLDHKSAFPVFNQRFWNGKENGYYAVLQDAPNTHPAMWGHPDIPPAVTPFQQQHFRVTNFFMWMFGILFSQYEYAAVLEDDLGLSQYLHQFFLLSSSVMDLDDTLAGASAWHDNQVEKAPTLDILRQNHFGGLGWMTSRSVFLGYMMPWMRPDRGHLGWDTILSFDTDKMMVSPRPTNKIGQEGGAPQQMLRSASLLGARTSTEAEQGEENFRGAHGVNSKGGILVKASSQGSAASSRTAALYFEDLAFDAFVPKSSTYRFFSADEQSGGPSHKERLCFLYPSVALTRHLSTNTHISGTKAEYKRLESLGFWPDSIQPQWPNAATLLAWNYERHVLEKALLGLQHVVSSSGKLPAVPEGVPGIEFQRGAQRPPTTQLGGGGFTLQERRQTIAANAKVHCLANCLDDTDAEGWNYMRERFHMIGVGWGGTPRQSYKGTVMVYQHPHRHFVVAEYSPYYKLLCT
ncbi:unnamed protein product [Amoebophrya sp. A120]|nr:unnamed protein product [Amoebophrya sp. A120]|eukprot:GSA120T00020633001.1